MRIGSSGWCVVLWSSSFRVEGWDIKFSDVGLRAQRGLGSRADVWLSGVWSMSGSFRAEGCSVFKVWTRGVGSW